MTNKEFETLVRTWEKLLDTKQYDLLKEVFKEVTKSDEKK